MVDQALQCNKGGLVNICHNNVEVEWGALCASDITSMDVSHEPLFNYDGKMTVTGTTASEQEEEDTERHEEE